MSIDTLNETSSFTCGNCQTTKSMTWRQACAGPDQWTMSDNEGRTWYCPSCAETVAAKQVASMTHPAWCDSSLCEWDIVDQTEKHLRLFGTGDDGLSLAALACGIRDGQIVWLDPSVEGVDYADADGLSRVGDAIAAMSEVMSRHHLKPVTE